MAGFSDSKKIDDVASTLPKEYIYIMVMNKES